jgi:hypothetical protein
VQPIPYSTGKYISRKTYRFLDLTSADTMKTFLKGRK